MSTQITTEQIKKLRDDTGISVMQCRRALEEAEGDMDKARAILKKTSSDIALKKVNREVKKRTTNLYGIPDLVDAAKAGTKQSENCTLCLTEGKSAKSLLI